MPRHRSYQSARADSRTASDSALRDLPPPDLFAHSILRVLIPLGPPRAVATASHLDGPRGAILIVITHTHSNPTLAGPTPASGSAIRPRNRWRGGVCLDSQCYNNCFEMSLNYLRAVSASIRLFRSVISP